MKAFIRFFLIVACLTLAAFMVNIASEGVKEWMVERFDTDYLWLAGILSLVFAGGAWVLDNRKDEPAESAPTPASPQTLLPNAPSAPPAVQPSLRFPNRSEYEAIIAEFDEDNLTEALDLMNKIPAYRERISLFRRQLKQLEDAEIENMRPEISRNEIANGLIKFIQTKQPQEEYDTPAVNEATGSSQSHIIKDPDNSLLWISRNFLGRADKIAEINGWLSDPDSPDIVVTGLAGNGKTTICHHVISEWLWEQTGRVAYVVEVEFITSVEGLSRALATICGLDPDRAKEAAVLTALKDLPGGLLYLDNLESILEDPEAHAFLQKLRGCRQLQILASSRREVAGFERVRLDVLSEADALELFQLNWRAQTGEAFPEADQELLTKFVTKDLGCHPLSIELTASHADTVTDFQQLLTEFRDSSTSYFTRFASGEDGRLDNLYQSLGLSVNRLKGRPNALRLLALCAVFESGLDGPMQQRLIKHGAFSPADRSLLIERNLARNTEGYFSLLPPVIRFLRSLLEGEDELLDGQQLRADGQILITDKSIAVLSRLEGQGFFSALGGEATALVEAYDSFDDLDFLHNMFVAKPILEKLLRRFDHLDIDQSRANVLNHLGQIEFLEGRNEAARKRYEQATELYRKTGSELGQANVLTNLGEIEFREGRNEAARKRYEQATELYRKTGSELGQANVLTYLGEIEFQEGRNEAARKRYEQARELYRKTDDEQGQANVLTFLGEIDFREGRHEAARKQYEQARELYRKTGDEQGQAVVHHYQSQIYAKEENYSLAMEWWERALEVFRRLKIPYNLAEALLEMTEAKLDSKSPPSEITPILTEAEQLIEEFGMDRFREKLARLKAKLQDPG